MVRACARLAGQARISPPVRGDRRCKRGALVLWRQARSAGRSALSVGAAPGAACPVGCRPNLCRLDLWYQGICAPLPPLSSPYSLELFDILSTLARRRRLAVGCGLEPSS